MSESVSYLDSVILGIVEGLTEYLPISSTGHLTVTEKLLGLPIDDPAITGYTATIQTGAILATLLYFAKDIWRFAVAWIGGLTNAEKRNHHDYQLAWAVIIGSIPVGLVGFAAQKLIEGPLRSLWVVAAALIAWSAVMWWAERRGDQVAAAQAQRDESSVTIKDGVFIGIAQCASLVPGVSRSGATISAGLVRGLTRVTATRLSFFMAIPALLAAGVFGLKDVNTAVIPVGPMILGVVISFIVAYASIAWLLRFVATNSLRAFIGYRVVAGAGLLVALAAGWIAAT